MTRAGRDQAVPADPVGPAGPAGGRATGIWAPLTSFLGRAEAMAELTGLVDDCQLVTVTGPGGVGKTRLAGEVARRMADRFPDGTWFIGLSAVTDPARVPAALMSALGVRQDAARPPLEVLAEVLAPRRLLLVLDNCEQVLPAVAQACEALLGGADDVRVLATSREPLGVSEEARYRLAPLEMPTTSGDVAQSPAAALFIERARQADARFAFGPEQAPLVAEVVTKLDGMPLAIELAAARVEALGLAGLAGRIDDALRLLTGTGALAAERHQSLAAVADWSYQLLTAGEQQVFRRLAVFPGGFTLEAAEAVAGPGAGPAVLRLADCSLVGPPRQDADQRTRYTMLETLRAYGAGRLREAGEEDEAAAALAAYAESVAQQAAVGLATTDREPSALHRLDAEDAIMTRALSWALGHDPDAALRLVTDLAPWLRTRGRSAEARDRLHGALASSSPANQYRTRAKVLLEVLSSGSSVRLDGDGRYTEVIEEHRGQPPSPELVAAFGNRAVRRLNQGKGLASASQDALRSLALARAAGDTAGELVALGGLCLIARDAGDAAGVLGWARHAERLLTANTPGLDKRWCLRVVGTALTDTGELDAARRFCADGITLARQADDASHLLGLLALMANIERLAGNVPEARTHLREAAGIASLNGDHVNLMNLINECGYLCAESGRWADAVTLWEACLADRGRRGLGPAAGDESDRAVYLVRVERALQPGELSAARERGARMSVAAAAGMALMIVTPAPAETQPPPPGKLLSPRERELVTLVARGHTNAQIAGQLHISVRTVASHLDRIRAKTGQRRRADLTRLALQESLI